MTSERLQRWKSKSKLASVNSYLFSRNVKDLIKQNRTVELKQLIGVVEELTATQNGNVRKGGLMGLAAVAIGLGKVNESSLLYCVAF